MLFPQISTQTLPDAQPQQVDEVMEILDDMITACLDSTSHMLYKRMFYNMGAHLDIINIIRRPLESTDNNSADGNRILIRCYAFLREVRIITFVIAVHFLN